MSFRTCLFYLCMSLPASAGGICNDAARDAARKMHVPYDILEAVSLVETGRQGENGMYSWPWTVNHNGQGYWFETKRDALNYLSDALAKGDVNIDIGCFQINYRWHSDKFKSLDDMISPISNSYYAASYLRDLYDKSGDWIKAVGSYHSETPEYSEKYLDKFEKIYAGIGAGVGYVQAKIRQNNYPLLKAGGDAVGGSLVPVLPSTKRLIGG